MALKGLTIPVLHTALCANTSTEGGHSYASDIIVIYKLGPNVFVRLKCRCHFSAIRAP